MKYWCYEKHAASKTANRGMSQISVIRKLRTFLFMQWLCVRKFKPWMISKAQDSWKPLIQKTWLDYRYWNTSTNLSDLWPFIEFKKSTNIRILFMQALWFYPWLSFYVDKQQMSQYTQKESLNNNFFLLLSSCFTW